MANEFEPSHMNRIFKNTTFGDVYSWDKDKILDFLARAAANPRDYGVTDLPSGVNLTTLEEEIKSLCNDKHPKSDYNFPPDKDFQQSIRRKVLGVPQKATLDDLVVDPTDPIPWATNDRKHKFFGLHDLLGIFLSLITSISGSAAANSSSLSLGKNYFLPLVVLYAKWGHTLELKKGRCPTMVQVTWTKKGDIYYPFFGASIGGLFSTKWKSPKKERWRYLKDFGLVPSRYKTFDESPKLTLDGKAGTRYGNCAETYPFLYIMKDQALAPCSSGISFELGKWADGKTIKTYYNGDEIWRSAAMQPPCANCRSLLKEGGAPKGDALTDPFPTFKFRPLSYPDDELQKYAVL